MKMRSLLVWMVAIVTAGTLSARANAENKTPNGEADDLRARVKELESAGKTGEADLVKRRLGEIEKRPAPQRKQRELAQVDEQREFRRIEPEERQRPEQKPEAKIREREERVIRERRIEGRNDQERRGPRSDDPGERKRRLRHVRAAIENLRAAGLYVPAERLEWAIERRQRQFREEYGSPGQRRPGPPAELGPQRDNVRPGAPERPQTPAMPGGPANRFYMSPELMKPAPGRPPEGLRPNDQQQLHERLSDLQGEVKELRRALKELRSQLEDRSRERR